MGLAGGVLEHDPDPESRIEPQKLLPVVLKLIDAKRLRRDDPQSKTLSAMANSIPSR